MDDSDYPDIDKNRFQKSHRMVRDIKISFLKLAHGAADHPTEADMNHQDLLRRAHKEYGSRAADQRNLYENGSFVRAVAAAMSRMPIATRLELCENDAGNSGWKQQALDDIADEGCLLWRMLLPMTWDEGRAWALETPHTSLLVDLPRAIHEAGTVLQTFDLRISSPPEYYDTSP